MLSGHKRPCSLDSHQRLVSGQEWKATEDCCCFLIMPGNAGYLLLCILWDVVNSHFSE